MKKYVVHKTVDDFQKMLNFSIAIEILLALIGGALLFLPDLSVKLIGYICGIIFLIYGLNVISKYFKREGAKLYRNNLVFGLIFAILGVLIILVPYSVSSFVTVMFGLYLITVGSNKINYGIWFKIADDSSWLLTMVIGLMLVCFGFLVIINPFANLAMTQLIGSFIIFASVLDLTDTIMLKRRAEKVIKIFW